MLQRISYIASLMTPSILALACVPEGGEHPGGVPAASASGSDTDALGDLPEAFASAGSEPDPDGDPERWDEDLPVVLPPWWKCGDSEVDPWEECDDGALNGPHKDCTPICRDAECGDGYVHAAEECDGGTENGQSPGSYGSCTLDCTIDVGCGDWIVQPAKEECDEGPWGDMMCTPKCELFGRVLFVTQEKFTGAQIGGLAGADGICQSEAEGNLASPSNFRAWLSTDAESVSDWLAADMENSRIMRPDGEVIAADVDGLLQGMLDVPVLVTASGDELPNSSVWTNTTSAGESASNEDCDGWTSNAGFSYRGMNMATNSAWTLFGEHVECSTPRHLYCLEQPEVADKN